VHADGGEPLTHLVQFEGFDDRDDEFHGQAFGFLRWLLIDGCANLASFQANGIKKLQR
jgi:hypothetical protein